MSLTPEQAQLFKVFFYTKLPWKSLCIPGELILLDYIDTNELVYSRAEDRGGQTVVKTTPARFLQDVGIARKSGFSYNDAISEIDQIQRLAAEKIAETNKQITYIDTHQYKSANQKKRLTADSKKEIKVFEKIIRDAEDAKKIAKTKI